jgi:predicted  nucleic acid-binding Zn-ribbon protein
MLITRVCEKEGCSGNKFHVNTEDSKLNIRCVECGTVYDYLEEMNYITAPNCLKCDSEVFKVNRDNKTGDMFINCVECNNPPRRIYTDGCGNQISYDQIMLVEIKSAVDELAEKVDSLNEQVDRLR